MNDLELLKDLGRVAREDEAAENARWERWEKWHDGELSDQEEAELLALARDSEEDAAALEAFRPLGPEFRTRVLAAIDGETAPEEAGIRRWFLSWRQALAGAALAAAALMFYVARLPAALPALRLYAVEPGTVSSRGDSERSEATVLLRNDGYTVKVQLVSEPIPKGAPALDVACFTISVRASEPVDAHCAWEQSGDLAARGKVAATAPLGPATLWIVVGYKGRLPDAREIVRLARDRPTQERTWVALPHPIEIRDSRS